MESSPDLVLKVYSIQPGLALRLEVTLPDLGRELVGPLLGFGVRLPLDAADPFLRDARIPHVVQI